MRCEGGAGYCWRPSRISNHLTPQTSHLPPPEERCEAEDEEHERPRFSAPERVGSRELSEGLLVDEDTDGELERDREGDECTSRKRPFADMTTAIASHVSRMRVRVTDHSGWVCP